MTFPIKKFIKLESFAGVLLGIAAILAVIIKNSSASPIYDTFLNTPIKIHVGNYFFNFSLLLCINDFMMAIFFLLVGAEIKRESVEGQLATKAQRALPAIASLGGIIIPAIIYLYFNSENKLAIKGWAIPTATDIAFSLGILALLGNRVSQNIKTCLLTLAILDDLAAVLIIAFFYTNNISCTWLTISLFPIMVLMVLNKCSIKSLAPYLLAGLFLWVCILKSGVHATITGVILAFFIPLNINNTPFRSPLKNLENAIHPWVTYCILPFFAFANAGVSLSGISKELLLQPLTLGIFMGLFFGKQIGVMLFSTIGVITKLCKLPKDVSWLQYYGMSLTTGVGFTMSLFIGMLAFNKIDDLNAVRMGVISGSIFSGIFGYIVLRMSYQKQISNA